MAAFRGEHAPDHPRAPEGSAVGLQSSGATPVEINALDVVCGPEDDEAVDVIVKAYDGSSMSFQRLLDVLITDGL